MAFGRKKKPMSAKWPPKKIRELRKRHDEPQDVFCLRLGITVDALRIWEQGRGGLNGCAEKLLDRIEEDIDADKVRPIKQLVPA